MHQVSAHDVAGTELVAVIDALAVVKAESADLQAGIAAIQGLEPTAGQFSATVSALDDFASNFASYAGAGAAKTLCCVLG